MLICHKLVASNEAAVLQACHVSDVHATMQPHRRCQSCQRRERYVPLSSSPSLIYHFWFLKHHHSAATHHHHRRCWRSCRTNENCIHAEYIYIFFYSMYLVLFSIVLYRTIVTVYTDNIFLYNYLRQMHQIIHPSPVGYFTPAQGKTEQKNRWVNGVKHNKWVMY